MSQLPRSFILRILFCIASALYVAAPVFAQEDADLPVFDFRHVDFAEENNRSLMGDWFFTYGKLHSPAEAHAAYHNGTMQKVKTPDNWRDHLPKNSANPNQHGYASYVVRLRLPEIAESPLVLNIPRISDAYEVYWVPLNAPETAWRVGAEGTMTGPLVASQGNQAHSLALAHDGLLLINVRSGLSSNSGIKSVLNIYDAAYYQAVVQIDRLFDGILLGFILIVAMLNLSLCVFHRKDLATLGLALAGAAIFIRFVTVGGTIETVLGPEWRPMRLRIEFANAFFVLWIAVFVNQTLLWGRIRDWYAVIGHGTAACIGILFCFLAPLPLVTSGFGLTLAFALGTVALVMFGCIIGIKRKAPNAILVMFVWSAMVVAWLCDVFSLKYYGHITDMLDIMFVLGIVTYSVQVGRRVIASINRAEFLEEERVLLQKLHQDAVDTARHDHLTGLLNRQAFDDEMTHAWLQREKENNTLSLILFDIDRFKSINDTHGHPVGDTVLRSVSGLLKDTRLRKSDRICRYGGEEFALILPNTSAENAEKIAERLRALIASHATPCGSDLFLIVTCSFGVAATSRKGPRDLSELVEQADAALYRAKEAGRNRVVLFDAQGSSPLAQQR
ncbi:MAG: diguanylate cyclase [Shimia sp.]|uniref:diguanylate cyclase n=1 Tax=Shimia sp. TaxID=1954381 RepID=UPI004058E1BD